VADLPLLVPFYRAMEVQYEGPAAMSEAAIRSALERRVFAAEASASALVPRRPALRSIVNNYWRSSLRIRPGR